MLSESCPECGTPLFRVGKEMLCARCNKPVIMIKASEDESKHVADMVLAATEQTLLTKIREVNEVMRNEKDLEKLTEIGNVLSSWLAALDRLKRLRAIS